ncbi:uncharacterized protein LOC124357908 [Homalodisca vitripennis]|uniref:uncharacterized protein LOC124357908 n=1 Tax=Homalodisca vitripennis TaxID=197043 RepID=UPI001EEC0CC7|nr:uncharacterized protein LOC124357908 [Homalodisca vitripennis]
MTSSPAAAPSKRLCGAASFKQSSMSVQPTRWRANLGFYLDPNNSHCDGTKACRLYGYLEKRSLLDLMSLNDFAKRVVVVCRENEDCVTRYDKWCKSNALRTQRISRHVHHICRCVCAPTRPERIHTPTYSGDQQGRRKCDEEAPV